ncbi:MAG: hypothetical protein JSW11_00245 [Candidatus Heimdallarchaeota archaeon]|nr:MAG: hypothetical protein JSW11_00245 [Candidatus Heimdallarchaeota archaeon]
MSFILDNKYIFTSGTAINPVVRSISNDKFVVAWLESGTSYTCHLRIGIYDGSKIGYGNDILLTSSGILPPSNFDYSRQTYDIAVVDPTKLFAIYTKEDKTVYTRLLTITGDTLVPLTEHVFSEQSGYCSGVTCTFVKSDISGSKFFAAIQDTEINDRNDILFRGFINPTSDYIFVLPGDDDGITNSRCIRSAQIDINRAIGVYGHQHSVSNLTKYEITAINTSGNVHFDIGNPKILYSETISSTNPGENEIAIMSSGTSAEVLTTYNWDGSGRISYISVSGIDISVNNDTLWDNSNIRIGSILSENTQKFDILHTKNNYGKIAYGRIINNQPICYNKETWSSGLIADHHATILNYPLVLLAYRDLNNNNGIVQLGRLPVDNLCNLHIHGHDTISGSYNLFIQGKLTVPLGIRSFYFGNESDIPENWERDTNFDEFFLQESGTVNISGGTYYHSHETDPHTHTGQSHSHILSISGISDGEIVTESGPGGIVYAATIDHEHYDGVTKAASEIYTNEVIDISNEHAPPSYVKAIIVKPNIYCTGIPSGIAVLNDNINIPNGFYVTNGNNNTINLDNKFILGADPGSSGGITGGSLFHNHVIPPHIHQPSGHIHANSDFGNAINTKTQSQGFEVYGARAVKHHHAQNIETSSGFIASGNIDISGVSLEPEYYQLLGIQNQSVDTYLPIGIIVPLVESEIPQNWKLCNGYDGTPNLLNKQIKITASGDNIGNTGGQNLHTHDASGHIHDSSGLHTHPYEFTGIDVYQFNAPEFGNPDIASSSHIHPNNSMSGAEVSVSSTSTTISTTDSRCPYKTVRFIKYIPTESNSIDLYINGPLPASSTFDLSVNGCSGIYNVGDKDLYINGHESVNNNINLFTYGCDQYNDNIDLFVNGHNIFLDDIFLFIYGYDTLDNNIVLSIDGYDLKINNIDLFIDGYDLSSNNIDLFIEGYQLGTSYESINLYVHGYKDIDNFTTLFLEGYELETSSVDSFINGYKLLYNSADIHIGGQTLLYNSIDLFISGHAIGPSFKITDLFIGGYNLIVNDYNLSIRGAISNNNTMALYVGGGGVVKINNNINFIINGVEIGEPPICPILDPMASIQISDIIVDVYQDCLDSLINQLGKNVILNFMPQKIECPNCEYDTLRRRSTGVYKTGGPRPFLFKTKCPYCHGVGFLEMEINKCIKCLIKWNPSSLVNWGISVEDHESVVRLKTYLDHLEDLMKAETAIVQYDSMGFVKLKVRRIIDPVPAGLREDRYCISFWELIQ